MALKRMLNATSFGDNIQIECYSKIASVNGNKEHMIATIENQRFDKRNILVSVNTYFFTPDLTGENFIAQAYNHLKTLPEFADAIDC